MSIRRIRIDNDPILRKKSRKVVDINKDVINLIQDMKDTLRLHNGLGIAAPQVGILKQIIVVLDNHDREIVVINPVILEAHGSQIKSEGCLSVSNIVANVERPIEVKVQGIDIHGNDVIITGNKRLARVFSHEIDHLNGILFTDKIYS